MAISLTNLKNKVENNGENDQGVLRAEEFNDLVQAVIENQQAVKNVITSINYNNVTYDTVIDGVLQMKVQDTSDRITGFDWYKTLDYPNNYISKSGSCTVEFGIIDKVKNPMDESETVPNSNPGVVNFYINDTKVDSIKNVFDKDHKSNKEKVISYDFNKNSRLTTHEDGNKLTVEFESNGVIKTYTATVYVIDINLTVNNFKEIYTTDIQPDFNIKVSGGNAKLYVCADSDEPNIVNGEILTNNTPYYMKDKMVPVNIHGSHNIKMWAEYSPEGNDEIIIKTNVIEYNYIYGDNNVSTPLIMTNIVAGSSFELYTKLTVQYSVYLNNETGIKPIRIRITDTANNTLKSGDQEVSFTGGVAKQEFTFNLFPDAGINLVGDDRKLVITINPDSGEVFNSVTDIKIANSNISFSYADGYLAYFSSADRNNNEPADKLKVWESTSRDGANTKTTIAFSENIEFTDSGSGWIKDANGNTAMHLRKGRYFTLNYTPFRKNPTYGDGSDQINNTGKGLTISFEFATRNCLKADSEVINCMQYKTDAEGNPTKEYDRGFVVTASDVTLVANDISLHSKFKEDTRIKMDIVIEGTPTTYTYDTVVGTDPTAADYKRTGQSDECLAIIYIDGVYTGITLVNASTTFLQGSSIIEPKNIVFGSEDCDLDIYNIRIYERALTCDEVVKNYSYDTPELESKVAIVQRNDIFNSASNNRPTIEIGKLEKARKDLPLVYVQLDETTNKEDMLPQNKSDWKLLSKTLWVNANRKSGKSEEALTSFESLTGTFRNQGTSSMTYPWPWRNWDWKSGDTDFRGSMDKDSYKKLFKFYLPTYENAVNSPSKWHQYNYRGEDDSRLPLKKLTFKKDYASSEMCNNAICSEIFTDMAIGIASKYPEAVSPTMQKDLVNGYTNLRLSLKAQPCFMFRYYNDERKEGSAGVGIEALGMMNLIPNKNEVGYLGFTKNIWENRKDVAIELGLVTEEKPYEMLSTEDNKIINNALKYREQSWELGDNLDDIFWCKRFDYILNDAYTESGDGTFTNPLKDNYEARTPKDSSIFDDTDFGFTPKGTDKITDISQITALHEETKDIIDFHNWLVDTNRGGTSCKLLKSEIEKLSPEDLAKINEFRLTEAQLEESKLWNYDVQLGKYTYEYDTQEFRLEKFRNEAEYRLLLDQWILYYIWREQFWMFDSGFKNLQVYTMGPKEYTGDVNYNVLQWGCMVRDADTALGIENTGKDYFPPHIEDTDYYTESNDVITFHYDGAKDLYHIKELTAKRGSNAKTVLNGQFGSVWVNLRDCFKSRIADMYRYLINNGSNTKFGASVTTKMFRDHQEQWSESLYNFGMRQYFGGAPFSEFNKSALGDKKNSRASWLERAFYYRMGKYGCLGDGAAFRINSYLSPDVDGNQDNNYKALNIKTYIPMYIGCGGTTAEMQNSKNIIRLVDGVYDDASIGKPISIGEEGFNFPKAGDAVSYVYGTSMITDIGDLARVCKLLRIQNMNFPKLRQFTIGHDSIRDGKTYYEFAPTYLLWDKATLEQQAVGSKDENGYYLDANGDKVIADISGDRQEFKNEILASLDCSSMTQLVLLDVTNHTNLSSLNIKTCDQLQELYARGTAIKSIDLPFTTALKKVYLGSELTSLTLNGLSSIDTLVIDSLNKCNKVNIKNSGDYIAKESYNIVTRCLSNLESAYDKSTNPNVCVLEGINWIDVKQEDLLRLSKICPKENIKGTITLKSLSYDAKIQLKTTYGDIDNNDPKTGLRITYPKVDIGSITLNENTYADSVGEHQLMFTPQFTNGNNFISYTWTIKQNITYKDNSEIVEGYTPSFNLNTETGILTVNNLGHEDNAPTIKVNVIVKCFDIYDGTEVIKTSDIDMTVHLYYRSAQVGDIVYNDGSYGYAKDYNSGDKSKEAVGICFYVRPRYYDANTDTWVNELRLMYALKDISIVANGREYQWGPNTYQKIDNNHVVAGDTILDTLPGLFNINQFIVPTERNIHRVSGNIPASAEGLLTSLYNTETNEWLNKQINWKADTQTPEASIGRIICEGKSCDGLPFGKYFTQCIIEHRDKVLKTLHSAGYKPEGIETRNWILPEVRLQELLVNDPTFTESKALENILTPLVTEGLDCYYFPFASLCYAYEPTLTTKGLSLVDKFKAHNWWLPAPGEMLHCMLLNVLALDDRNGDNYLPEINKLKPAIDVLKAANKYNDLAHLGTNNNDSTYYYGTASECSINQRTTVNADDEQVKYELANDTYFVGNKVYATIYFGTTWQKRTSSLRRLRAICEF